MFVLVGRTARRRSGGETARTKVEGRTRRLDTLVFGVGSHARRRRLCQEIAALRDELALARGRVRELELATRARVAS
jgi:hypothetical protein